MSTVSSISNLKVVCPKLLRADYHGCVLTGEFISNSLNVCVTAVTGNENVVPQ